MKVSCIHVLQVFGGNIQAKKKIYIKQEVNNIFDISAESLPKRLLQKQLTLMSKSIEADVKCMSISKNICLSPSQFSLFLFLFILCYQFKINMSIRLEISFPLVIMYRICIIDFTFIFVLLHVIGVYKAKIKEIHQKIKDNNVPNKSATPQNVQNKNTTPPIAAV